MTLPLIVDCFAGGGGASEGIRQALGRGPDVAINHDAEAIALHQANHPETLHLHSNVWQVDPDDIWRRFRRPVGLLWASPDCKHFSKAKGGRPVKRSVRDLAWTVVLWARRARPGIIVVENVEEFADWGPLADDGRGGWRPCPDRRGDTFRQWVAELERLGYRVEWRMLRGCEYGAPTVRRRLFLIARCDGLPIVWPTPTYGAPDDPAVAEGRLRPWRTAAEILDWSLPCPSIFLTREEGRAVGANRPLSPKTLARIARGVQRYVLDAVRPFIVPITHGGGEGRTHDLAEPLRTITTANRGELALVAPSLATVGYGEAEGQAPRAPNLAAPLGTVVAGGVKHALVAAHLASHYGAEGGRALAANRPLPTVTARATQTQVVAAHLGVPYGHSMGAAADGPAATVTTRGKAALVAAFLAQHNTGLVGHGARKPVSTIVGKGCTQAVVGAHLTACHGASSGGPSGGCVAAFLQKYYGTGGQGQDAADPLHTVPTRDRFGLVTVTVEGVPLAIVDIGMRMLTPRELYRAQGFPDAYAIDRGADGGPLTKTAQIRMAGNSVCPPLAAAIVAANASHLAVAPADAA